MIGRISGTLLEKHLTEVLVDVQGIAYEIQVPMSTLYTLPEPGQKIQLHTHFVVREDAQLLYGFADIREKDLFRTLIKVNGVGPRIALAILSGMAVDEFVGTIQRNDLAALTRLPGVGRKTAERLVVEMRDRLKEWHAGSISIAGAGAEAAVDEMAREAAAALVTLGYKAQDAARVVSRVARENPQAADSESLIRLALKSML